VNTHNEPLFHYMKTGRHPQNRKYMTHHNVARGGRASHGHVAICTKKLVKFGRVVFELSRQTDRQTDVLMTIRCTTPADEVGPNQCGTISRRGGFKIVEFEFRVRVRVSSNFLPLTSTKTVELPN